MQQTIQHLAINNPCHESWADMTSTDKGRHCASCKKEVVDFSVMSTTQVLNFLSNRGNLCGRFGETQLEKINQQLQDRPRIFKWTWAASIALLITSLTTNAKAKSEPKTINIEQTSVSLRFTTAVVDTTKKYVHVTGKVVDLGKEPIIGAIIRCKNTPLSTVTNINGEFSLNVPEGTQALSVSFVGYYTREFSINDNQTNPYNIALVLQPSMLGDVIVITHPRQSFFKRQANHIKRLLDRL